MKMREIKLMRIMTALSISVEDEQEKRATIFFFERMEVVDQM